MRRAQPEEQGALVGREPESLLRKHGSEVFGGCHQHDHHRRDLEALPVAEKGAVVDQHPHADQEEGDEDGVAHEFDAIHERRGPGDQPVHGQTGQERPDDGFEPRGFGQERPEEDHRQHEDVLRDVVATPFEEPAPDQREEHDDHGDAEHDRAGQPVPEPLVGLVRGDADDDRQHQQRQDVGDDGASHGDHHRLVAGDAQFAHQRIGDQGLRSEQRRQQHGREERKSEDAVSGADAEEHGDREGVESEYGASPAVAPEIGHVHFEAREEHNVEQSGRSREDDAAVAQHEIQPVGADDGAGDDEPQQIGDAQFVEQQRRREDDHQDQHELEDGILQRQGDGCWCEKHNSCGQCRTNIRISRDRSKRRFDCAGMNVFFLLPGIRIGRMQYGVCFCVIGAGGIFGAVRTVVRYACSRVWMYSSCTRKLGTRQ